MDEFAIKITDGKCSKLAISSTLEQRFNSKITLGNKEYEIKGFYLLESGSSGNKRERLELSIPKFFESYNGNTLCVLFEHQTSGDFWSHSVQKNQEYGENPELRKEFDTKVKPLIYKILPEYMVNFMNKFK